MAFNGPGPGRPKGGLNKTTVEVRNLARAIVDDPNYRESLVMRLKQGTAPQMETLLWHYAYGKPKETVEVQGENITIAKVVREIVDVEQREVATEIQDAAIH